MFRNLSSSSHRKLEELSVGSSELRTGEGSAPVRPPLVQYASRLDYLPILVLVSMDAQKASIDLSQGVVSFLAGWSIAQGKSTNGIQFDSIDDFIYIVVTEKPLTELLGDCVPIS
jgi:hypothetical protein